MALKLNSSGGGSVTIDPVSTASNVTITVPATTGGSVVVADSSGNVTATGGVSGTTGTFSGAVSGTTGTFTGNVQMASQNGGQLAGLRNKIINGSFTVNQRGITTVTPTGGDYTADRWLSGATVASKYSITVGTAGAIGIAAGLSGGVLTATSLSAYTVGAAEQFSQLQRIEGYNIADLGWGTTAAKTVTLSFFVNSSLTGTFGGSIKNSANTRSYPFTYSIPASGTWTRIRVTIDGDTTGASTDWPTTNGIGLNVLFSLGCGATISGTAGAWAAGDFRSATGTVSVVGTSGAYWQIANVQLEVGSVATPFEQRPIGMELALCQRYYETGKFGLDSYQVATGVFSTYISFQVAKRTAPTIGSGFSYSNASGGVTDNIINTQFRSFASATTTGTSAWVNVWNATAEL